VQSDPDQALAVLYRLRDSWATRSDAGAQTLLKAIDSLIAEYDAARNGSEEG
jgi:hypothetical protein